MQAAHAPLLLLHAQIGEFYGYRFRVVTPDDIGNANSFIFRQKEPNKYDVDVSQLDLPAGVTGLTLQGTVLLCNVTETRPLISHRCCRKSPQTHFTERRQRQGNQIVFTVGIKDDTSQTTYSALTLLT